MAIFNSVLIKNLITTTTTTILIIIVIIIVIIIIIIIIPTEHVKRHDGLAKVIHEKLAEAAELIYDKSPRYKYTPANVLENENFKLY